MFGVNSVNLQDPNTLDSLLQAGITESRTMANIPVVYASSQPNWSSFDWNMQLLQNAGLHPMVTLLGSPAWLQPSPNPCAAAGSPAYNAPPNNVTDWAKIAASYVAHLDANFPGLVHEFEVWNEPELQKSFCVTDNLDATRLSKYLALYSAAASAMRAQAKLDGVTIKIGGPVVSNFTLALEWIPALLSDASAYPNVDFVSYHMYLTGQPQITSNMNWSQLYGFTQSSTRGETLYFLKDTALIRKGKQSNPTSTPIYVTEFNDNWVFAEDCCRNSPVYGPLWNSVAIVDFLNTVYAGANSVPTKLFYFAGSAPPYFCIAGAWNTSMNCDPSALDLYPQYYAYKLLASSEYLDLSAGGFMAASVTPINTQSGLLATAFYTSSKDAIVIVNPESTAYSTVTVLASRPGYSSVGGAMYTLNQSNPHIASESVTWKAVSGGFQATITVPAYSTVALTLGSAKSSQ
jgi:Glycosyl hydrolases family 39